MRRPKARKKTAEGVEKGVGETEKGIGKAADKTADALDKTGDKMSDTSVTTHVKTGFTDEPLAEGFGDRCAHHESRRHAQGNRAVRRREGAREADRGGRIGVTRVVNDLVVR